MIPEQGYFTASKKLLIHLRQIIRPYLALSSKTSTEIVLDKACN